MEGIHDLMHDIHDMKTYKVGLTTVDGVSIRRSPVEVGSFIPLFIGFHTSQVVQDFSHQQ